MKKTLRIVHKTLGAHVHCRVFIGNPGHTFAFCGDLVFSVDEWGHARHQLEQCADFIEERRDDARPMGV